MSRRPWRSTAWSMIRWPASSRLMSSCRAVPCTSLATAARWSPAAGMSTTTSVAPSRCRVRAIAAPMPRAAPVTTATLPASGFSASAGSCPSAELTVRNCPSTNAERPERKNRRAPRVLGLVVPAPSASRMPLAVAPARSSLASERRSPSTPCRAAAAAGSAASTRRARDTVMTRAFGARSRSDVAAVSTGFSRSSGAGQFVQHQDDGAELLLGHRVAADIEVPGQQGRRPARRRRCRCPGPGRGR